MAENVTRQTKSDKGIQRLVKDVLQNVLGLPDETTSRVFKILHARGDWITVKQHVRQNLPTVAWQRINQALDMIDAHSDDEPELDERDPEMEPEEPVGDGESDAEMADQMDDEDEMKPGDAMGGDMGGGARSMGDERREGFAPTFLGFLSEISAQQTARMMIRDQQTRRDAALQTDNQRRTEITDELTDLEGSEDSTEKNLAMQIKRTAMLRKRVDDKQAQGANRSQKPRGSF